MRYTTRLRQRTYNCPQHGAQELQEAARVWESNLLQQTDTLKMGDGRAQGQLVCGCEVDATWYVGGEEPEVSVG